MGTVVDQALTSSVLTKDGLKSRLTEALQSWLERQVSELNALVQDMELQLERQLERPSWQVLTTLIEGLSVNVPTDVPQPDSEGDGFRGHKKRLLELNSDLARTTSNLRKLVEAKPKGSTRTSAGAPSSGSAAKSVSGNESLPKMGQILKGVDVATTVIPFALDAFDLINEYNRDAAQAEAALQRRVQIEAQLEELKRRSVRETFTAFDVECDAFTAALEGSSASVDAVISARRTACLLRRGTPGSGAPA